MATKSNPRAKRPVDERRNDFAEAVRRTPRAERDFYEGVLREQREREDVVAEMFADVAEEAEATCVRDAGLTVHDVQKKRGRHDTHYVPSALAFGAGAPKPTITANDVRVIQQVQLVATAAAAGGHGWGDDTWKRVLPAAHDFYERVFGCKAGDDVYAVLEGQFALYAYLKNVRRLQDAPRSRWPQRTAIDLPTGASIVAVVREVADPSTVPAGLTPERIDAVLAAGIKAAEKQGRGLSARGAATLLLAELRPTKRTGQRPRKQPRKKNH
jgi:catechol 2,3-dioxygenase-like lactoylglutathione lyase family enzyme